jgi:hypothetical protein
VFAAALAFGSSECDKGMLTRRRRPFSAWPEALAVVEALKPLRQSRLIECTVGRGSEPNNYFVPLSAAKAAVRTGVAETGSARRVSEPVAAEAPVTSPPPRPSIRELVAERYRPFNDAEFAEIQKRCPDEAGLRKRLELLILRFAKAGPETPISFFLAILDQFGA